MFSAAVLSKLRLEPVVPHEGVSGLGGLNLFQPFVAKFPVVPHEGVSGLGGLVDSVVVETEIQFTYETNGKVTFRGQFAAVTELEALDISVLGRDITGLFAVIADQPWQCRVSVSAAASLHDSARSEFVTSKVSLIAI